MTTRSETETRRAIPRSMLLVGGGLIAFVLVALFVASLASGQTPTYPADTPEGTFQRYLQAFEAGDLETAYGYFSSAAQAQLTPENYRRFVDDYHSWSSRQRIVLDRVDAQGDQATLHLSAREGGGGPFGGGYEENLEVRLVRETPGWRIDQLMAGAYPIDPRMFEEEFE